MVKGVQTIALIAPVATTNAIFSWRRANRGLDNIGEHPVYGAMNLDIAAGQVLKGTRAALCATPALEQELGSALNGMAQSSKVMNGFSKIINFTADNINPIICVTSGFKVLGAEKGKKLDTAAGESLALLSMFGFEGAAKSILGMPAIKRVDGKTVKITREALYKKVPVLAKWVQSFENYCSKTKLFNKIPLSGLPGIICGVLFVAASICGYNLGAKVANRIINGKPEERANVKPAVVYAI